MINPCNFIPNPSSSVSEFQQYLDYENAKFLSNTFGWLVPLIMIMAVLIAFVLLWLTRREADKIVEAELNSSQSETIGKQETKRNKHE